MLHFATAQHRMQPLQNNIQTLQT